MSSALAAAEDGNILRGTSKSNLLNRKRTRKFAVIDRGASSSDWLTQFS
jgi:hypothetical protein